MTPERFRQVEDLFHRAKDLAADAQRALLDAECGKDVEVRSEVEKLLAHADPDATRQNLEKRGGKVRGPGPIDEAVPAAGPAIPGYEIIRELGRGGMGVVYEAIQEGLGRKVALKVLPGSPPLASREAVSRFKREASSAAKLHHTHIVPIYDSGESGHAYYYAMELVEGQPLSEMIRRFATANAPSASPTAFAELLGNIVSTDAETNLTPSSDSSSSHTDSSRSGSESSGRGRYYFRQVAQWMADAADALQHAHTQGIIHRDIKPSNLMLSRDGRIMILDFGLAKSASDLSVTRTGSLLGTLRYMSPEQAMAKRMRVDHRTDIYSLGATLYELLTFRPAFQGSDEKETLGLIITREPTPPRKIVAAVPREMETICLKTLEKDAGSRYASARELADDLRRYIQDLPIVARPVGPIGRVVKFVRRRRALAAAIGVTVLLAVSIAVAFGIAAESRRKQIHALTEQGAHHYRNEDWKRAEEAYTAALELDPENPECLYHLAIAKKAIYAHDGNARTLEEASALLERALRIRDDQANLWNLKGVILRMRGNLAEAVAAHRRAVELDSAYYANWVSYGTALAMQGEIARAEECLARAVTLPDGSDALMAWHNLLAVQLQRAEPQAVGTLNSLEKLLRKQRKTSVPAILLRAKVFLQLPGFTDSQKALDLAITASLVPGAEHGAVRIQQVLALARLRNRQWEEAARVARQMIEMGDARQAMPHLILAVAEARLEKKEAGRRHLKAAEAVWPSQLKETGFIATADAGWLWFDTSAELRQLREEAEVATADQAPQSQSDD